MPNFNATNWTDPDARFDRWFIYLNSLYWEAGHLDRSTYLGFLRAASLGISEDSAYCEILRRIKKADPHARFAKLEHQLQLAYSYAGQHRSGYNRTDYPPPPPRPKFDPDRLAEIAAKLPEASPEYLRRRSPIDPALVDTTRFLQMIFRAGESVLIFSDYTSQGQLLWRYPGEDQRRSLVRFSSGRKRGVWYLCNPVDGIYHYNPRVGHKSRRSEESITDFRHLILESDVAGPDQWIAYLAQLDLPILAIYSTGGRSPHALARIDTPTKATFDRFVRARIPELVRAGACQGSLSAVRLSRLPGCRREEKNAEQKLYYLNANPTQIAICRNGTFR
jgi:hypothetical protein